MSIENVVIRAAEPHEVKIIYALHHARALDDRHLYLFGNLLGPRLRGLAIARPPADLAV